jgi:hypothetical protein
MPSGTVTHLLYGNAFFLTIQHRIGYNAPKLRVSILAHDANRIQPWTMAKKQSVTVITVNIQLYDCYHYTRDQYWPIRPYIVDQARSSYCERVCFNTRIP